MAWSINSMFPSIKKTLAGGNLDNLKITKKINSLT